MLAVAQGRWVLGPTPSYASPPGGNKKRVATGPMGSLHVGPVSLNLPERDRARLEVSPLAVILLAATLRGSLGASTCSLGQPTIAVVRNRLLGAGQPRAREAVGSGAACGAILSGLRDYSWPVNIDSASSGATAQLGSTVFRARQEVRRAAESGALSGRGRGQGEDVSSVICSEWLPERSTHQACRQLKGSQQELPGCTKHLSWGWRDWARTRAALVRSGLGRTQSQLLWSLRCCLSA